LINNIWKREKEEGRRENGKKNKKIYLRKNLWMLG